jgi:hypothetical protein
VTALLLTVALLPGTTDAAEVLAERDRVRAHESAQTELAGHVAGAGLRVWADALAEARRVRSEARRAVPVAPVARTERPALPAGVPHLLRVIAWCEAGSYIGLPKYQTNYSALNQQGSTASGGYQVLDSTWNGRPGQNNGWKHYVPEAVQYARAVHAPPHVQDAVATAAFHREGTSPWNASRSCWVKA